MEKSAGLLLINNSKILLCHPTNASWSNTFSIPKGRIENGENILDAAIRETKEEIGIDIDKSIISHNYRTIQYSDKTGKIYKEVYYYPVYINDDIVNELNNSKLQLEEVDWCGFLNKEEAKNKIFWRFKEMLDFI